jgi:hypothetical protein
MRQRESPGRARDAQYVTCPTSLALQAAFVADDVSNIIKEAIDAVLQNQQYSEAKVGRPPRAAA